jgi:hypothetical protein
VDPGGVQAVCTPSYLQKNIETDCEIFNWEKIFEIFTKIPWYPKLLFQRENALASF